MKVKKNTKEKGFKKLILSWWFWVIVAVIFYIIFVSIPIQWTGEGLEEVEGTGFLKTLFAYLTQIAWIIAIVLLIVHIIKAIQKSKIGDYWKISFTILGIVGIIAFTFFSVKDFGIFDNFSNEYDNRIGESDKDKIKLIKISIESLEEDGYEVLYFGYFGHSNLSEYAYVKMKSLGWRNEQVWRGLDSLSYVYPNAPEYDVKIVEEKQNCWYVVTGKLYRAWLGEEFTINGTEIDSHTAYNLIEYGIANSSCI